jgi:hypothetical protein
MAVKVAIIFVMLNGLSDTPAAGRAIALATANLQKAFAT